MTARAAVPFVLKRGDEVMTAATYESTTETIHGLVRLESDRLVFQWRLARQTDVMGSVGMHTDRELEPVQEVSVPLSGIAGAHVRTGFLGWLRGPRLVLSAADLSAFEVVAGPEGLKIDHPAQLQVRIRRRDRLIAEEFCAELALALAERAHGPALEGDDRSAGRLHPGEGVTLPERTPVPEERSPAD